MVEMAEGTYDVYQLIHSAANIAPVQMAVNELRKKFLDGQCWSDLDGGTFSPEEFLAQVERHRSLDGLGCNPNFSSWCDHVWKVRGADYRYPILMYRDKVIDGTHRLVHAIIDEIPTLPVRVFETLPPEALYIGT
jgi:hypothetical protein